MRYIGSKEQVDVLVGQDLEVSETASDTQLITTDNENTAADNIDADAEPAVTTQSLSASEQVRYYTYCN